MQNVVYKLCVILFEFQIFNLLLCCTWIWLGKTLVKFTLRLISSCIELVPSQLLDITPNNTDRPYINEHVLQDKTQIDIVIHVVQEGYVYM